MSVEIPSDTPGLAEANAELDRLIAADAAPEPGTAAAATEAGKSATQPADKTAEATRAGQEKPIESAQDQNLATDTPAAAEKQKAESGKQKSEDGKTTDGKAAAEPSRHEKARQRQEKSWQELNAQKAALAQEKADVQKQREELQAERAKAQTKFKPEDYEHAAEQFEKEGKLDMAEAARARAEQLRKNPPDQAAKAQAEAQTKAEQDARKEWALKAGVDFPEIAKDNSPLQVRVAQLLQEEPDFKTHPKGIYVAARIAALETASASVPAMEKELGQLRAKVKELEGLTAPGGPGGATALPGEKSFDQKSEGEQLQELTETAQAMGPLR